MMGIEFLGKHSYHDFGLSVSPGKSIGMPDKEKIMVKVPFSNEEYDFSRLYGTQTYTTRELSYPFNVFDYANLTKIGLNNLKTQVTNWIMNSDGKQKLYDDAYPGYYFLSEAESAPSFGEDYNTGILTVKFKAYPFMIAELEEGNDIWDTFNFDLDVSQDVTFDIDGTQDVTLINAGVPDVYPTIETTSEMSVTLGNKTYTIPAGTVKSDIPLISGENDLTIIGTGTINFIFYKELI